MKKILFLPLFRFSTGHHQVADALMYSFEKNNPYVECKKVDFLSYTSKHLESLTGKFYLKWISKNPKTYDRTYKKFFYSQSEHSRRLLTFYEHIFLEEMESLINLEQPDLIVCTHGFPSFLLDRLKKFGKCKVPVTNAYTDFFINDLWGKEYIDYHLAASREMKERLMKENGLDEERIIVAGIPVDERIRRKKPTTAKRAPYNVMVAGGNIGLKNCPDFLFEETKEINYYFLCGKNTQLFKELLERKQPNVVPLPYISSRLEMDALYDQMDAIVTKPGGVTISEAMAKGLMIFVHSPLPGQEEINAEVLRKEGLCFPLTKTGSVAAQLKRNMESDLLTFKMNEKIKAYFVEMEIRSLREVCSFLEEKAITPATSCNSLNRETVVQSISNVKRDYILKR